MNEGIKKVVPHRDSIRSLQYSSVPVGLPEGIFYSTNYFFFFVSSSSLNGPNKEPNFGHFKYLNSDSKTVVTIASLHS